MKNSENLSMYPFQNSMDMNVILKPEKNTKYFIRLTPKHFWNLHVFGKCKIQSRLFEKHQ